jgi:hypothetical protein
LSENELQLKCYVHRDVDAIGVCSECGQGICDICAVRIGGKLYCKADADRVFSPAATRDVPKVQIERPLRVTISSILFVIYGLVGIGLSFLFIIGGFVLGGIATFAGGLAYYNSFAGNASVGFLLLGGVFLFMGVIGIVCGYWLWRVQIWGASIGMVLLAIGMALALIPLLSVRNLITGELTGTVWLGNIAMMILLFFSWPRLARASLELP